MDEFCWSVSRPDYRAPAVRRVHIPKGKGKTRPIGIPTVEDKILQRAVTMVLSEVYEQDFLPCSFGYRPGRSAHRELEALWEETMKMGGGWVLEWISSGSLTRWIMSTSGAFWTRGCATGFCVVRLASG